MNNSVVIFDLDGTLLYTLEDIMDALNRTLFMYHLKAQNIDEVKANVGNGSFMLIRKSVPNFVSDREVELMLRNYSKDYEKNCNIKTKPYDGIVEQIKQLKTKGYKVAVVSNKPDAAAKNLINAHLGCLVDITVGETSEVKRKPAPDTINKVVDVLNVDKETSYYIGDSEVDIEASKNAGIRCISVSWGFRTKEQLEEAGAEIIIESTNKINEIITK